METEDFVEKNEEEIIGILEDKGYIILSREELGKW